MKISSSAREFIFKTTFKSTFSGICTSVSSENIWHQAYCCHTYMKKKKSPAETPQQNAIFCWEQHHFWGRHCSRWISRCLTTKALASVWDDMCWPKSRSIFGGRRGCQHPLGLRVTDGPNHTERHGHIHPEHALMYHLYGFFQKWDKLTFLATIPILIGFVCKISVFLLIIYGS